MNINNHVTSTNFKSSFPVQHWVTEAGGCNYAPVFNNDLVKILQRKMVSILNKPLKDSKKPMKVTEQNLRAYIGKCDPDYRSVAKVRSFYTREGANIEGFTPVVHLITGQDVDIFEENIAKSIGKEKHNAKEKFDKTYTPETIAAIKTYKNQGLQFVNNSEKRIASSTSGPQVLHTKFEVIRNKIGEIINYVLVDTRFLPEKGPQNPFVRLGMIK